MKFREGEHDKLLDVCIVTFIILCLLFTACVPKKEVKKAFDEGYKIAEIKCTQTTNGQVQLIQKLRLDNAEKTKRLSHFNQVDNQGNLIPLKKTIKSSEVGDPREGS